MNYKTNYQRDPTGAEAAQLVKYVRQSSGVVRRGAGVPATDDDLDRFEVLVSESELSRHHVFAFADEYPAADLADRVAGSLREELEGTFVFGIHTDTEHNHVHVAQAGRERECFMDADDIDRVRQAVAAQVPESIGDGTGGK